jgi:Zn-dependent peptidase ImmA (M78 family)
MNFEKSGSKIEREREPITKVIGSSQAPKKFKENPLFNSYHWGMADWEEKKLYLPDSSDEAITFSIAAHELGHLVNKGRIQPDRENFEATRQEELRAWEEGGKYLEKHLSDYYDDQKVIEDLKIIVEKIREKMMEITLLSEPFYRQYGTRSIKQQRELFLKTELGQRIKAEIDGLRRFVEETLVNLDKESFLKKTDWDKFVNIIKMVLIDIEKDNKDNE